jgi:hypothetical protein
MVSGSPLEAPASDQAVSSVPANAWKFHDLSLAELSGETRRRLTNAEDSNLFRSLEFCESYNDLPARRVALLENSDGVIAERCFYRESELWPIGKKLDILSPVDLHGDLLGRLKRERNASIVNLSFLEDSDLRRVNIIRPKPCVAPMADDSCVLLPASVDEYLSKLGSARKRLPYYIRRLDKEWDKEWQLHHSAGMEISISSYEELLELNRCRMSQRRRRSLWTAERAQRRWRLFQACGLLSWVSFRGKMTAGTLSLLKQGEAYLIVVAHDPTFDRLNLGNVILWLTIQRLIQQGLSQYHLLWGDSFYKKQFGGVPSSYFRVTLFSDPFVSLGMRTLHSSRIPKAWSLLGRLGKRSLEAFNSIADQ